MTHFIKPKKPRPATPRACDRCRERPGVVHLLSLEVADPRAGSSGAAAQPETDWWLCSECARLVGRDEPGGG